jgi:hypothetical protein
VLLHFSPAAGTQALLEPQSAGSADTTVELHDSSASGGVAASPAAAAGSGPAGPPQKQVGGNTAES